MATARYDKNYEGWILEYTDHRKIAEGKRGDSKKKFKDREYPKLPKRQKQMKEAQMLNLAMELESNSKRGMVDKDNVTKPINAIEYLSNMRRIVQKTTRIQSIEERKRHINEFVEFLSLRFKKYYLHEINKTVAREFFAHHAHVSLGTLDKKRKSLSSIFNIIQDDMDELDSPFRYRNPFLKPEILDGIKIIPDDKVITSVRKIFEVEHIKEIIERATAEDEILGFLWQMGWRTGWRESDILNLKWKQIDLKKRFIEIVYRKTKEKEIKGRVYITDKMLDLLESVRKFTDGDFLFPANWRERAGVSKAGYMNRKILDDMGLDETESSGVNNQSVYTFHGLRGTIKTTLKNEDFNRDRIDFLTGHRGKGVDADHYDKFYQKPKESTQDLIEFLEHLLD